MCHTHLGGEGISDVFNLAFSLLIRSGSPGLPSCGSQAWQTKQAVQWQERRCLGCRIDPRQRNCGEDSPY